jgi:phosphotransferase system enzyme I (PtsI)
VAREYRGLGVSPGVAIGRVFLLHRENLPVVPYPIPPERLLDEVELFHKAREAAKQELRELKEKVLAELGDHYAGILEAQLLIIDDPSLTADTEKRIKVGRVSARWAIKEVVQDYIRRFEAMDDTYLRERGGDLSDIHLRLQRILSGAPQKIDELPEGPQVVVAYSLSPSDAVILARKGVAGLASDVGGRTSHTAILAQALSVPAVAGLRDMSLQVSQGEEIILDGDSGEVLVQPSGPSIEKSTKRRQAWMAREKRALDDATDAPAVTRDGVEIILRANIEFPSEVDTAIRFGARGIGLYRSEFLFLSRSPQLPTEEEHYQTYLEMAERVHPHPAIIRTLDLGGEKFFHEVLDSRETNPVLGLRAIRFCLKRPDIFRPQLRGLLRAATIGNIHIMVPLVTTAEEIREVRKMLAAEAEQLKAAGHEVCANVPLGIMIEVPAAAAAADILAREVDFFSIGTNDLIQYSLAVDRGNQTVSYLYQPHHPGVLRMLKFAVDSARERGIPVSLCGEMAADIESVGLLLGLGLRELSVPPRAIPDIREVIGSVDTTEAARLGFDRLGLRGEHLEAFSGKGDS